ncbi:alpha-N-arabinofuranosidase [Bradyrhizobium sp. CCGB12]|uniref:arabinosylfuranosidase ArfA n=1 Tax=Bradyrhizobium sp. CCGB12 TaxID=2949632 RepID=UPI0020B3B9B9|nr:alpha-N-arabinofuranosidase [Bradyrhizobium sp. CCGB12]MCP3395254.1 alpha-N-arabinofuranosidase [Bradyrhizobium sp. CCGB12]
MAKATIILDPAFVVGKTDPRLFGSFVEHLGRCVYGGIFEPGHPTADTEGFRQDVMELVRELGVTVVRYPGGNFVSGYNWEDGVGPVDQRPRRRELAWFSTETNAFGTNEFMSWCAKARLEPMMAVNLGTRGADEARELLEYCNVEGGTALSDLRHQHGHPSPHGVKLWCLGNEMDAPWQIGAKTAVEYGTLARESAKLMRWLQPDIELVACGSSSRSMATFAEWERVVLEETFDVVEYISLHGYFSKHGDKSRDFMAEADLVGRYIDEIVAVADGVAARRRSSKRIMLSFDEWNVWYRTRDRATRTKPGWPEAPAILEELFTMEDALVFGAALLTLINRCDRVKAACVAQLVNVIGLIMTETGGRAWRQPIFYPFKHASDWAQGTVLDMRLTCGTFTASNGDQFPDIVSAAVLADGGKSLSLFCVNRNFDQPIDLVLSLRGMELRKLLESRVMRSEDLNATNTADDPERVKPVRGPNAAIRDGAWQLTIPPASWSVFRFSSLPRSAEASST